MFPASAKAAPGVPAERQREPLCAYFLLCMALWKREGWRKLPEIARASSGKPYFPEYLGIHFNLSHTKGAVLAGVADRKSVV